MTLSPSAPLRTTLEATFPLSPAQQGMLYHTLLEPEAGIFVEQMVGWLPEALEVERLLGAWRSAIARHSSLRTSFRFAGHDSGIQEVRDHAELDARVEDWRGLSHEEQERQFEAFLAADRARGFALDTPPLHRLVLLRLADTDYRMVFTFHHAILDGRGLAALFQEVFGEYEAGLRGEPWTGPDPVEFRSYVEWLERQDLGAAEQFWRPALAGFRAPTPLVVDRPVDAGEFPGSRQGHQVRWLEAAVSQRLTTIAATHGVNLNTVMQGAWAVLLSKYSGESDVVFGVSRACRRTAIPGAEGLVAHLTNVLPLRVMVDAEAPFFAWLRTIRAQWSALGAVEHSPPSRVLAWSEVPAGQPLFESIVNFDSRHWTEALQTPSALGRGRRFEMFELTSHPLALVVYGGERVCLKVEYDRRRFDDGAIERILDQLGTLLDAAASAPLVPLGKLPLLSARERQRVIEEWNDTTSDYPRHASIQGLFSAEARRRPDAIAVTGESGALTYAELDAASNRVANLLRRHGVNPGAFVGLALERSPNLVAGILGVLKAGCSYVPLHTDYPEDRLRYMLDDVAAAAVLTERSQAGRLPNRSGRVMLIVDAADGGPSSESSEPLPDTEGGSNPAYVMYTSGSTGRPKGVVVPHRAVVRLVRGNPAMEFGEDQVFLMLAPISFDASTLEIWGALLNGGTLALAPVSGAVEQLGELVLRYGVTTLWLTAALFQHVVDTNLEALRPLRQLLAGGDVLPTAQVRRVVRELPLVRLINGYGPTENTTFTCCHTVTPADIRRASIPIGRPIGNTTVYLVDREMTPVPIGVPGDLYAGGDGLALGYLNQPELNAERFIPSPFHAGERLYRTGDRARWRPDGVIEFLGRLDTQVKIRGFRIEPGEIEAAIAECPGVREAVVVCREDRPGEKRLVAYFTEHDSVSPADLRRFSQARLPEYMVPSAFVRLDSLPVTTNGKVDRKALPAPPKPSGADDGAGSAPSSALEAALTTIWQSVLRIDSIGRQDNYFELGGDSILSIQIAARARKAGLPLSVGLLVRHQTIADLAAALDALPTQTGITEDLAIGEAPLTPIQNWFFEQDRIDRHHWNQAFLFTSPALDMAALRRALEDVIGHHDALRLRFRREDGQWRQRIAPAGDTPAPAELADLSSAPDHHLSGAISQVTERAARSLDLTLGPCIRAVHLRLGADRGNRLLVVIHHLVVDGVSWRILLEDLESAYRRHSAGSTGTLPQKTTSYRRWSTLLAERAAGPELQDERAHWTAVSHGSLRSLPGGNAGAGNTVANAATVTVALEPAETVDLLQRIPQAYNTQANDALLTALADALTPWVGEGPLLLDLEGHGREEIVPGLDTTRTIGWFTTIFPVRLELGQLGGPGARLKAMKERLRGIPRRGIGYGILRYLGNGSELADRPQAQIVFNYLGQFDQITAGSSLFGFASEDAGPWLAPGGVRRHLIEINALVLDGRLEFRWTFCRGIHDEQTIRALAERLLGSLRELARHCLTPGAGGRTPSDYPLALLSQDAVDRLAGDGRTIEDILPLAPMQELFLAVSSAADDIGFEQWRYTIEGSLDQEAFRKAWALVSGRHAILRAGFALNGVTRPVQVIHRQAEPRLLAHDWRDLPSGDQDQRLADLLSSDRALGFQVEHPALLRLHLIRFGEESWTLIWSHHHLLLDRWSWPIVLRDVGIAYHAICSGHDPDWRDAPSWRSYIAELQGGNRLTAEAFWRSELEGIRATSLPPLRGGAGDSGEQVLDLTARETADLLRTSRERRVTLNAMVATAWALCLARLTGTTDVVMGLTVAGRPDHIPGIAELVGMCINNVPIRLRFRAEEAVGSLVERFGERQSASTPHAQPSLLELQQWSGLPWHERLFNTLLVFQHHGADSDTSSWLGPDIETRMAPVVTHTNYPLALVVTGSERLSLRLAHLGRYAGADAASLLLHQLRQVLLALPELYASPSDRALALLPEPEARQADTAHDYGRAPVTSTEWVIARIWAELLGREAVGTDRSFFDLGGQSLVATQIMSRIRDAFRLELPVSLLFEHPTVAGFAAALGRRESVPGRVERIATVIRRVEEMSADDLREAGVHE